MIQTQTILNVADNSGAKTAQCIRVLGGTKANTATIGSMIVVSIKSVVKTRKKGVTGYEAQKAASTGTTNKVKKGQVYRAIVIRTKKGITRPNGIGLKFDDNSLVLIHNVGKSINQPVGTRIFGPVTKELKHKGYLKIVSLAKYLI